MGRGLDDITGDIVDAAIRLHTRLGPGLLETVYELVLAKSLVQRGYKVERQLGISFDFEGLHFKDALRADLVVEDCVIVEVKSVETVLPVHKKQLLTYLRLSERPIGLLTNFGGARLKDGLHRIVNALPASASPRLRVNQNRVGAPPAVTK